MSVLDVEIEFTMSTHTN